MACILYVLHFNIESRFLQNKMHEIENTISSYHPHVIGISESNFFKHHQTEDVQLQDYKFIPSNTLDNDQLNVSRVVVYLHNSVVGKVRHDLMNDKFSSIWLEVGLPRQKKILIICNAYREWQYLGQKDDSSSLTINQQLFTI